MLQYDKGYEDIDHILKKYLSQLTEGQVETTWLDVAW